MFSIHRFPFVRLFLAFAGGIVFVFLKGDFSRYVLLLPAAGGVLLLLAFGRVRRPGRRHRWEPWAGGGILLLYFSVGLWAGRLSEAEHHQRDLFRGDVYLDGVVLQYDTTRSGRHRLRVLVVAIEWGGRWYRAPGKAVLYFSSGDRPVAAAGEHLLVRGRLLPFPWRGHPGEFHYRRYMEDHGFWWQLFVEEGVWRVVSGSGSGRMPLVVRAARARERVVTRLRAHSFQGRRLAVAAALLAGERSHLDPATRDLFAGSGTMHVLAISGLHTGILYMVLMAFFSLFGERQGVRVLRFVVVAVVLWGYAFFTGLTPSVVRAALMFSLFLLAATLRRRPAPHNTLAAAAFLMVVWRPVLLRDVAFQLSFLVVLGIITFYPRWRRRVLTGRRPVDAVVALVLVSLSAQLATFPLTLYHFHRISFVAPLVNLLVIPLITLILYGGFLWFLLLPFPAVAAWLALLLGKMTDLLLEVTAAAASWPHLRLEGVWLSPWQVVWLYLLVAGGTVLARRPSGRGVIALQLLFLTGLVAGTLQKAHLNRADRVLLFDTPRSTTLLLQHGQAGMLMTVDADATQYYTVPAVGSLGIRRLDTLSAAMLLGDPPAGTCSLSPSFFAGRGFFRAGNITGYLLTDTTFHPFTSSVDVDLLIFSGRKWWRVPKQMATLRPGIVVLDAGVPSYVAGKLKEEMPDLPLHAVRHDGPFLIERLRRK